ncbi:MAG: ATP-binding cassette domain-containing protein, partial [Eubacteriales bacterium]
MAKNLAIENNFVPLVHDDKYVLEVNSLKKYFQIKSGLLQNITGYVKAVDGISFKIERGTTMGLVGESGCGKTTVGRALLRLTPKSGGEVLYNGIDIYAMDKKALRTLRPKIQIIFQDPYSSLSPRLPIGEIIGEAVRQHKIVPKEEYDAYIDKIMASCGLQPYHRDRYPHEFSGGQRQRICIARAL